MGEPVTKQDLDQAMGVVRGEMAAMESRLRIDIAADMVSMEGRLRTDMAAMEDRLHTDMATMEERIVQRFDGFASQIAQVMSEQFRDQIRVFDEKYQDLPKQHAELRADFDSHACNYRLHKRPVALSTKRLRRTRSR